MRYTTLVLFLTTLVCSMSYANNKTSTVVHSINMNGKAMQKIPNAVCHVANLRELHFASNKLTSVPVCINLHSMTLSNLNLSSNQITDIQPIVSLLSLRTLDLRDNKLGKLPPEIGNLVQLERLYLERNGLKELPASMSKLVYLKHLDLSFNQLAEVPEFLPYLVNLESIHLEGNPALKPYIELIRRILPGVDVRF